MLDIGWSEMAMVALLALLVIGPKDLPGLMRTVGQYVRKARGFARDFQSSLDEMIQDDELKEAKRAIEKQTENFRRRESFGIGQELERHVDPSGSLRAASREVSDTARDAERVEDSEGSDAPHPSDPYNAAQNPLAPGGESAPGAESHHGTAGETAGEEDSQAASRVQVRETPVAPGHSLGAGHGGSADTAGKSATSDETEGVTADERGGEAGSR